MTARSSSFLCPKLPNAPTSAAAFAQLPSPSGYRPSGLRPAAHWHLSHRLSSQRFSASAAASPQRQNCTSVICDRAAGATPSTKMQILCSKRPKTGVSEGKSAQKPRFCAREEEDWHREAQPLPSCKSPSTLLKCKHLITRQLTFGAALGEHKSRPPRGPMCPRGA